MVFVVVLKRTDMAEPIELYSSKNESEADKAFEEVCVKWAESAERKIPFKIKAPIKNAFPPGLIHEVFVEKMSDEDYSNYKSDMGKLLKEQGTTGFMNQHFKIG